MPAPAVEVKELSKRFGKFVAVDRVSFSVAPGEIFGFLGSNGAGKTTAIRVLCGLLPPSSGEARVLGLDVAREPDAVKRRIGYMSQRFSLYEDLTPLENLTFFGGVYGLEGRQLTERRETAMALAGLQGAEHTLTRNLQAGFRQRLALASALLHSPAVVFLDEPTGGVDPLSRRRFWEIIDELSLEGVTVFVTTHYLDEAERCGRLALMHAGKLLALGSLEELRSVFAGRVVLEIRPSRLGESLERLQRQAWAREIAVFGGAIHLVASETDSPQARVEAIFTDEPVAVRRLLPSLEDVFIDYIRKNTEA